MKLTLQNQVEFERDNSSIKLKWPRFQSFGQLTLKPVGKGVTLAIEKLKQGGLEYEELAQIVLENDGLVEVIRFQSHLKKMDRLAILQRTIFLDNQPLLTFIPRSFDFVFDETTIETSQFYILSRFAYWHRVQNQLVVESPTGHAYGVIENKIITTLFNQLLTPQTIDTLLKEIDLPQNILQQIFLFLKNMGVIVGYGQATQLNDEETSVLQQWEFHDLLFHAHTRGGRSLANLGGTYRFLGEIPPTPAVKPSPTESIFPLPQPNLEQLLTDDISLTQALENRKSVRSYEDKPLTAAQIGEFLFRTARIKTLFSHQFSKENYVEQLEFTTRPYPGGGAEYPLEIYLAIRHCDEIPSGFYHYCPLNHHLSQLTPYNNEVETFIKQSTPPYSNHPPQIAIAISARFQRISWKYERIAYALILKECGVLTQNFYLVATAMGLAPCAMGFGDAELFSKLAQTNYYEESCVGNFALGI